MKLMLKILMMLFVAAPLTVFISGWWIVALWRLVAAATVLFIAACMANPRGCGQ